MQKQRKAVKETNNNLVHKQIQGPFLPSQAL